jgi:PST family polysaccharide transporter
LVKLTVRNKGNLIRTIPQFLRARRDQYFDSPAAFENTAWLFFDRILRIGVGLIIWIWIARHLGPEQFGIYNYAIAFVALFGTLVGLGLDSIVVRDLVLSPASRDELLGTVFTLRLAGGLLTLPVTVGVISAMHPADMLTIWLVAITASGLVFQSFDVIDFWFRSKVQSKYAVYARDGAFLVATAIRILLILIQAPLVTFAWAGLAEMAFCAAGLVCVYHAKGFSIKAWSWSLSCSKEVLSRSWPLILSGMVIMVYMRIDQLMLGEMIGAEAVGLYSAVVRVSEGGYFIPIAIVSSLFPSIVEAKKVSEDLYYLRLAKLFRLVAVVAFAIAIPMTFASAILTRLLF